MHSAYIGLKRIFLFKAQNTKTTKQQKENRKAASAQLIKKRYGIISVANGCDMGRLASEAACNASDEFLEYVRENIPSVFNLQRLGIFLTTMNTHYMSHHTCMIAHVAFD